MSTLYSCFASVLMALFVLWQGCGQPGMLGFLPVVHLA
jgi:hypothetical protein